MLEDKVELFNILNQEFLRVINLKEHIILRKDFGIMYLYRRNGEIVYDVMFVHDLTIEKV